MSDSWGNYGQKCHYGYDIISDSTVSGTNFLYGSEWNSWHRMSFSDFTLMKKNVKGSGWWKNDLVADSVDEDWENLKEVVPKWTESDIHWFRLMWHKNQVNAQKLELYVLPHYWAFYFKIFLNVTRHWST